MEGSYRQSLIRELGYCQEGKYEKKRREEEQEVEDSARLYTSRWR